MLVTLHLCTDCLSGGTLSQLREIKSIYGFACNADVLRWMLEPKIAETVTKEMRKKIRYMKEGYDCRRNRERSGIALTFLSAKRVPAERSDIRLMFMQHHLMIISI